MATRMALDISLHQAGTPAYKHSSTPTEPWRLSSVSCRSLAWRQSSLLTFRKQMRRTWCAAPFRKGPTHAQLTNPSRPCRLLCYSLDKMLSCQMGKPSAVYSDSTEKLTDEEPNTTPDDRRVYANVKMSQILTRGMEAARRFSQPIPSHQALLSEAIKQMDVELERWWDTWLPRITIGLTGLHGGSRIHAIMYLSSLISTWQPSTTRRRSERRA